MKRLAINFAVAVVALAFVATALGGSLTAGYAGLASGAQGAVKATVAQSRPAVSKAAGKTTGTLPFTGLDLTVIVAGGFLLLLTGLGIRRAARAKS